MNKGVNLITPVILVRFLSVEDFGYFREFLVYAGLLTGIAAFGITGSLLRFVPENPQFAWRFVDRTVWMTLAASILVVAGLLLLEALLPTPLVGDFTWPLVLYVLFFVNVDFWVYLWLAQKRSLAVLGYSTGRLVARVVVVTVTAILTRDVNAIIFALVCFEGVRLAISAVSWRMEVRKHATDDARVEPPPWRNQLDYCLPFGAALVVVNLNRSMGSLFVAKMLGPIALAHYAIGLYVQPVLTVIRNSLSDVILPEIVSRNGQASAPAQRLKLWQRTTVVTAITLLPVGVVLAKFADLLVTTLFSEEYRPAVVVFQIYLLVFLREVMDFGIPLRAMDRNKPVLYSNLIAIVANAIALVVLVPLWGVAGAVAALVFSRFVDGAYLARELARAYQMPLSSVLPWKDLFKVLCIVTVSAVVLFGDYWTRHLGLLGAALGSAAYCALLALLLLRSNIPEVGMLVGKLRSMPALLLRRSQ